MKGTHTSRRGFRTRATLGSLTLLVTVITAVWPDWLEAVLRVNPDGGNGMAEVAIVFLLAAVSIGFFATAWTSWRRFAHRPAR
ncbi:MAG: ABC transporter permease [Actinomycetota bacterium]|nr:ABC transporter permease [Actinomycetota bacterium]